MTTADIGQSTTFFGRNEFLIRRLHSLSGLVPVGAYMVVHLLTNASVLDSAATFQKNVYSIHALGSILPVVEWGFIFGPILFHMLLGFWIIASGKSNTSKYKYTNNYRYSLQRWTGVIAAIFIMVHVFHLHGWFHMHWWIDNVAAPLGMAQFRPYNAGSTLALALEGFVWPVFYVIGLLASVFHLANGIWTFGITWGIWISPAAQTRATNLCAVFGVLLAAVGLSALWGFTQLDPVEAKRMEDTMYEAKLKSGELKDNPEKRTIDAGEESVAIESIPDVIQNRP